MNRKTPILAFLLLVFNLLMRIDIEAKADPAIVRVPEEYQEIQKAIDHANPGDMIIVSSGTYREHLTINKSISLIGEGASNTILDGGGNGTIIASTADGVAIIGISIVDPGGKYYSGSVGDAGILMYGSYNLLQEIRMVGGVWGISLKECADTAIRSIDHLKSLADFPYC